MAGYITHHQVDKGDTGIVTTVITCETEIIAGLSTPYDRNTEFELVPNSDYAIALPRGHHERYRKIMAKLE